MIDESQFSRNALWLHPSLHKRLSNLPLLIIGCGGTGILFLINAAHLGFRHFTILDPDILEESNLNRYIICDKSHVGAFKVDIAAEYVHRCFPSASVKGIPAAFPDARAFASIESSSYVVGCVDDVTTRVQLDLACRKYNRTLFDLGSGFVVETISGAPRVREAGAQVLVSRPGSTCLRCLGFRLDGIANHYKFSAAGPEPSSILLNNIVCAIAVELLLREIDFGEPTINRVSYLRSTLSLRQSKSAPRHKCQICGPDSYSHVQRIGDSHILNQSLDHIL